VAELEESLPALGSGVGEESQETRPRSFLWRHCWKLRGWRSREYLPCCLARQATFTLAKQLNNRLSEHVQILKGSELVLKLF
jgi:hypothetical protein